MGCCAGSKLMTDTLAKQKEANNIFFEEERPAAHVEAGKLASGNAHSQGETREEKVLQPIMERDDELVQSGKPGWKEPRFISQPDVEQKSVENSPIHIIYSSDHDYKEPPNSTIKKNLFQTRQLDQSVIHEVSQEYIDSNLYSQQGSRKEEFRSANLKNLASPTAQKLRLDEIKIDANEPDNFNDEQVLSNMQLNLPKLEIQPVLAKT